ncbi:hypothetical protein [Mycoplasmopsis felis]|uniref:hypothetical protein n=1 Tax=Mycoplasmopsis felis TaxID=33923 RepID=UPI00056B8E3E|nr:hypothetical protein [Mycoplasmopsis felis]
MLKKVNIAMLTFLSTFNTSDDVSFKKIYLKKGEKISIGLAWNYNLKNKKNGNPHVHDFDLKIIGPNNFEKSSQMTDNNYERVVFEVPESGEYNFKVKPYESLLHSDEFHVALSFVKF